MLSNTRAPSRKIRSGQIIPGLQGFDVRIDGSHLHAGVNIEGHQRLMRGLAPDAVRRSGETLCADQFLLKLNDAVAVEKPDRLIARRGSARREIVGLRTDGRGGEQRYRGDEDGSEHADPPID
jgi:hypothetical protein